MKSVIVAFCIVGTVGFLCLIGYAIRSLYFSFGGGAAFAGVACVLAFMFPMALLIDLRRARVASLLDRIELRHGIDLTREKAEVADI